jgi:NAD(P)-dependent dehydrogenase (short-subunit alcohol dehydrogenase family)
MDLNLKGKVAIVTGGGSGIGLSIVQTLLNEGMIVALFDRNAERANELDHELGPDCHTFLAELTNEEEVKAAVQSTIDRLGRIDVLVNNAGVNDGVGLDQGPTAFMESLNKNLVQAYSVTHHCVEELKKSEGFIINIGSKTSMTGQGNTSGYAAAKGGLNSLTREWAVDLAPHHVCVNCIIVAESWTPQYETWLAKQGDCGASLKKCIEAKIPLGNRFTHVDEIAAMTAFLSSPVSAHTTGQLIHVDGGYVHLDRAITS